MLYIDPENTGILKITFSHADLVKQLSADKGEIRTGFCPECNKETKHKCVDIDPDKPNDHLGWQCQVCRELIEIER